jgi:hypothetical protein
MTPATMAAKPVQRMSPEAVGVIWLSFVREASRSFVNGVVRPFADKR